jgi:two-component system, sensor histidine kinase ChiS
MKLKNRLIVVLLMVVIGIISVRSIINTSVQTKKTPKVTNGVIDLTDWDFNKNGNVPLDGDWEFYSDKLLTPSNFSKADEDRETKQINYLKVPSAWNNSKTSSDKNNIDSGTYRVKIKLKKALSNYGVKITNIRMANKVFIDGYFVSNSGYPATSLKNGYKTNNVPNVAFFTHEGEYLEMIIQVSNFDYTNGGIVQKVYFGTQKDIMSLKIWMFFLDVLSFAFLAITGLYYIGIYIGSKEDRSLLYFGLYSILSALIVAMSNEKILMQFFNKFPYVAALQLKDIVIVFTIVLLCLFIKEKLQFSIPKWFLYYVFSVSTLNIILILIIPMRTYGSYDSIFQLNGILVYFMLFIFILHSIYKKKYEGIEKKSAYVSMVSILFAIGYYLTELLYAGNLIYDTRYASASIMLFLFTVSMLLSQQYATAFSIIKTMSNKLIHVDKLKDEFLVNTSHELKTPLHGIINITQSILDERLGTINSKQEECLSFTVSLAKRLASLINDIIDFQSLKNNALHMDIRAFDASAAVQVVVEVLKYMCSGKSLVIINSIPSGSFYIIADENRLKQIIYNLVGNALQYTEAGNVEITAVAIDGFVKLSIIDTGSGIDNTIKPYIFDTYEHFGDNSGVKYPSTGLGLPISQRLAQYMGGKLWLEWTEVGIGSCFSLTLPASAMDEIQSKETNVITNKDLSVPSSASFEVQALKAQINSTKGAFKILLVDDEVSNIKVLTSIFSKDKYEIFTAFSGKQALDIIDRNHEISLILLDVMMPGITGFEVCKKIRKKYSLVELPILMLTVRNTPSDIETGFNAGANDFLEKPFDSKELMARATTLINLKMSVKKAKDNEIAFLQAQVKPHFLFNALNSIAALCRKEPEKAENLTLDFAAYLRSSFDFKNLEALTTINKEVEHVKHYLNIEKVRFGKRLEVEYDIEETFNILIPPLIMQPLVENAVKHGISSISRGGKVIISIKSITSGKLFSVSDNGKGMSDIKIKNILSGASENTGIGISNINKRLNNIYGIMLKIESKEDKGTTVSFVLPDNNMTNGL